MPDEIEARDAYLFVEVPLPNKKLIRGRPLLYVAAKRMLVLDEQFANGADPSKSLIPLLEAFEEHTGITEKAIFELCPDITLGEVVDLVRRFFFWRRTVHTETPNPVSPPTTTAPPAGA